MTEEILEEEIIEVEQVMANGEIKKVYLIWQQIITHATLVFYVDHLQVIHRTKKVPVRIAPVLRIGPFFVSPIVTIM